MIQEHNHSAIDHLEELRKRILFSLIWVSLFSILCFCFSDILMKWMTRPIEGSVQSLYFLTPYEAFLTKMKLALIAGVVLSLPVIFAQLWAFIGPGLYPNEKKEISPLILLATVLFIGGVLFAYFMVLPFALNFFLGFRSETLAPTISIGSYVSFFSSILISFGVVFDIPVIVIGLISTGILNAAYLASQRKYIILGAFIIAAILTPTVDMITQCMLAFPLWFLFELSIVLGRAIEQKKILGYRHKNSRLSPKIPMSTKGESKQ